MARPTRILRDVAAKLSVTFYEDGNPVDADGAVTVEVTKDDGTQAASGTAAHAGAGTGTYEFTLDPQADLDILMASWSGTFSGKASTIRSTHHIVGGFYVTLADIRTIRGLSDEGKYPVDRLEEQRDRFEDLTESRMRTAFVPRYGRAQVDGRGTDSILLPHVGIRKVRSLKVDDVDVSADDFRVYPHGKVKRTDGGVFSVGVRNVDVVYEYGKDAPPGDVRDAALEAIGAWLLGEQSDIPDRATTFHTDIGTYTLTIAGVNRPTGIPTVDAVLTRYWHTAPTVR